MILRIIIIFLLAAIVVLQYFIVEDIAEAMKQKPQVINHYLLPKDATCAVKEMLFRDSQNNIIKSTRKVCEFKSPDQNDPTKGLCHWELK